MKQECGAKKSAMKLLIWKAFICTWWVSMIIRHEDVLYSISRLDCMYERENAVKCLTLALPVHGGFLGGIIPPFINTHLPKNTAFKGSPVTYTQPYLADSFIVKFWEWRYFALLSPFLPCPSCPCHFCSPCSPRLPCPPCTKGRESFFSAYRGILSILCIMNDIIFVKEMTVANHNTPKNGLRL